MLPTPACAVTPPGHYTAGDKTLPCPTGPTGSYRAGWAAGPNATSCVSCAEGMLADKLDVVVLYDTVTGAASEVAVATHPEHCCKYPNMIACCLFSDMLLCRTIWCWIVHACNGTLGTVRLGITLAPYRAGMAVWAEHRKSVTDRKHGCCMRSHQTTSYDAPARKPFHAAPSWNTHT